jgi:CspA family cold shock protein
LEGTVKRWLDRGYGFIEVEDMENDIFVHYSEIEGAYQLQEGQKVEFTVEDSPRGPRAVNVKIIE